MNSPTQPDSLVLTLDLQEVSRLGAWLEQWCQTQHLDPRFINNLHLCAEELVVNVINHGFDAPATAPIIIELEKQPGTIRLSIEDSGKPFDPTRSPTPEKAESLEDATIGGWGIHLVRQFSRTMRYQRRGQHNRLVVEFNTVN